MEHGFRRYLLCKWFSFEMCQKPTISVACCVFLSQVSTILCGRNEAGIIIASSSLSHYVLETKILKTNLYSCIASSSGSVYDKLCVNILKHHYSQINIWFILRPSAHTNRKTLNSTTINRFTILEECPKYMKDDFRAIIF